MSGNNDHHTSGKYHIKPCSLRKNIVFPKPELKSEMAIVSSRFSIIYGEVDGVAIIYCFRDGLSMFFFNGNDEEECHGMRRKFWVQHGTPMDPQKCYYFKAICNIEPQIHIGILE